MARITLVKGIPFYGFHVGYRFFLKIYMFNPVVMTRLADLLQQGVIMKRKFQPYEAHLQYLLQFMTDYNLYGCDYLDLGKAFFRAPVPDYAGDNSSQHLWHDRSVPSDHITDDFKLPRVSHCSIEVDLCVQDIINRQRVKERRLHHDFVERAKPPPSDKKLVYSMAGLWKDETKRRKSRMPEPTPGSSPFPAEALVSMSADPRDTQDQGWIHEVEYREEIQKLIAAEKDPNDPSKPDWEGFVKQNPLEMAVQTALQSVEDLYPTKLMPALGLSAKAASLDENPASSIDVDEQRIRDHDDGELDLFPDDSDEEWLLDLKTNADIGREEVQVSVRGSKGRPGSRQEQADNDSTEAKSHETLDIAGARQRQQTANELLSHPPSSALEGVCASRLSSGKTNGIQIREELLEVADEHGLISRNKFSGRSHGAGVASLKRSASVPISKEQIKRPRIESAEPPVTAPPMRASMGAEIASAPRQRLLTRAPHTKVPPPASGRKNGSKGVSPSQSNQVLNFPVSKSQERINNVMEPSQKYCQPRAQISDTHSKVTFDPAVSVKDGKTLSADSSKEQLASFAQEPPSTEMKLQRARDAVAAFSNRRLLILGTLPPLATDVSSTLKGLGIANVIYQDAYYSNEKDVPPRAREYAGREFRLESNTLPYLPSFDPTGTSAASRGFGTPSVAEYSWNVAPEGERQAPCSFRSWQIAQPPPSFEEVQGWWADKCSAAQSAKVRGQALVRSPETRRNFSQIDGPTPKNKYGFKYSQRKQSTSVKHEAQYMSTLSLEIHVNTRGRFLPNPEEDEVQCVFWAIKADGTASTSQGTSGDLIEGIVVLSSDGSLAKRIRRQTSVEVVEESEELDLMVRMIEIVRTHDPDILTGYEVHGSSWGYLIERARLKYDYDLCDEFSRMKSNSHGRIGKENDRWGFNTTSTIRVTGRHMINVWRAMRGELNLLQYTMENVTWQLLHRRIPHYSWQTLTEWYTNGKQRDLSKLLRYYLTRTKLDIEILESNELIPRTSEQARLLGVDFFSVFSRGSQFKVESIMFRIAKPENFMLVSPNRKQVGGQNALECLPLVMEPQSAFYSSPLLVLDFQSLYPSVMIAYNLCYSTFLGRIVNWRGMNKMGFTEYKRHQRLLELLKDHINIAPNGMMYCKSEVRKSLLAKMLTEILETRVMVKSGMKQDKDDKTLQRLLNNRQLALKLLANVTYGYTSASFSGRMPCAEIADSIVQTGRETLERAIAYIHSQERWGAEVVYGDTDSLFVYLKGRTRDQAFDIGNEIAKAITDMNPRPVKLKFEKVYHPCVLMAKKRYVGHKFESKDQVKPDFDAKGIETVRRDGTPAEQKIEERALKLLFETADLSQIKAYFQSQCEKIMRGAVSVQDFCFAKEVKLGSYSDKGPPPPGALISTKRMLEDARAEPQYGERVPYVVITGAPGARLIDRCVAPEELLRNSHARLDAEYYISKNLIPPLERIFNLVGANVRQWYDEMPKVQRVRRLDQVVAVPRSFGGGGGGGHGLAGALAGTVGARATIKHKEDGSDPGGQGRPGTNSSKKTLESYMKSASCMVCDVKMRVEGTLCARCRDDAPASLLVLQSRLSREEKRYLDVVKVCRSCAALPPLDEVPCDSKDCPVFYSRVKQSTRLGAERSVLQPVIRELGAEAAKAALEW